MWGDMIAGEYVSRRSSEVGLDRGGFGGLGAMKDGCTLFNASDCHFT